jgi:putative ABC transport system substrate-binding protein
MIDLRRREFMALLGAAAAAWPLAAHAQQPTKPVIGFLTNTSFNERRHHIAAFRDGLNDAGYVEGRNVAFEFRWAEGYLDRLEPMVADLISNHRVAIIVASGSPAVALAAKAVTRVRAISLRSSAQKHIAPITKRNCQARGSTAKTLGIDVPLSLMLRADEMLD